VVGGHDIGGGGGGVLVGCICPRFLGFTTRTEGKYLGSLDNVDRLVVLTYWWTHK
jgi:hypothetical protein